MHCLVKPNETVVSGTLAVLLPVAGAAAGALWPLSQNVPQKSEF